MTSTDLGPLAGGRIKQYANHAGQIYYYDTVATTTSYAIPNGFQDGAGVRYFRHVDRSPGPNIVPLIVTLDRILGFSTRQRVGRNGTYGAWRISCRPR